MFILKKRQYTWLDMYRIPFSCAPAAAILVTLQKAITALVNVFQVIVVANFLDGMISFLMDQGIEDGFMLWFVLMLLMVSWKRVSYHIGRVFTNQVIIKGNQQVAQEFVKKRASLEYPLVEKLEAEELLHRVTDKLENKINQMFQSFLNFFVIYIPRIAGVLLIIAAHVWWLAVVVMVMTIPLIFLSMRGGKKIYHANKEAAVYERRHKYLFDLLAGREAAEERSLFAYSGAVNGQWHNQYEMARKIDMKAEITYTASMHGGSIITSILAAAISLIMIPLTASGILSVGLFISLSSAVYDLVNLVGRDLTKQVSQMAKYGEYMKDVTAFAALPEREGENPKIPVQNCGEIPELETLVFRHVTFCYPGSEIPVLKDFSMELKRGVHYAIVGENGAGKSTLVKLMMGLYREYDGEILYNGRELRAFPEKQWLEIFSCVFQDFARYYLSVGENIRLGIGGIDLIEGRELESESMHIQSAAKQINIHDAVLALNRGYDTELGKLAEGSVDLSGGQWQRVAMARALMNHAPVLLLDEPTAALDPVSESQLYDKFGEISKNRTTIFISHRLGSTRLADHILVLKDGCIREQGSHEGLMAEQGVYAAMYETQQSWYTKEGVGEA